MSHEPLRRGDASLIPRKALPDTAIRALVERNDDSPNAETSAPEGTRQPLMVSDTKNEYTLEGDEPSSRPSFRKRCRATWRRFSLDTWLQELLSIAISFICLAALVILLFHYDHKPIREWTAGITLNAVISILITILDAALALPLASGFGQLKWVLLKRKKQILQDVQQLDYASRSTTGSFTLLLSLRGRLVKWISCDELESSNRCSIIGSGGALLAILMIAIGPFAQQVVSVSFKEDMTGKASLGKAVNATEMLADSMAGTWTSTSCDPEFFMLYSTPKWTMLNALQAKEELVAPLCP
jgi:hypothetical protein